MLKMAGYMPNHRKSVPIPVLKSNESMIVGVDCGVVATDTSVVIVSVVVVAVVIVVIVVDVVAFVVVVLVVVVVVVDVVEVVVVVVVGGTFLLRKHNIKGHHVYKFI